MTFPCNDVVSGARLGRTQREHRRKVGASRCFTRFYCSAAWFKAAVSQLTPINSEDCLLRRNNFGTTSFLMH